MHAMQGSDRQMCSDGETTYEGCIATTRRDSRSEVDGIGSHRGMGSADEGKASAKRIMSRERQESGGRRRVKAKSAQSSAVVAREGPGDAEPSCSTGTAAVPTAAVPVALGEAVTILTTQVDAPQRIAGGGEVTSPPNGAAAPLEFDSEAGAIGPRGQDVQPSSQRSPATVGGGRPHKRASTSSPQGTRTRRRAGLRSGEADEPGERDPPRPKES